MFAPNSFVQGIIANANTPEAIAAREATQARTQAYHDNIAADKVQIAADKAYTEANPFVPDIPAYYSNADSAEYVNPYYVGPNTGYSRFDTNQVGAGIQNLPNPAAAFDAIIASQFTAPLVLPGPDGFTNDQTTNVLGGMKFVGMEIPEGIQQVLDYNEQLQLQKQRFDNYFGRNAHPEVHDFFNQRGIDINSIKSAADLDAIPAQLKGDLFGTFVDAQERAKQFENQKAKSGIGDALGGFGGLIGPVFGGLVGGPLGGAIFGGLTGGFDSGPLGALTGALSGYGIGNTLTHGITNPFTGTNYTGPIAHGGSGIPFPTGDFTPGGRDILDVGGIGNPFPDIPGIPRIPGGTSDTPPPISFPPILIPPGGPPGRDDTDESTPPLVIPPIITTPPPTGGGGVADIPTIPTGPTNLNVNSEGGLYGGRYIKPQIPGPPGLSNYFDYNADPFRRFI